MRACHVLLLIMSTSIAAADAPPKPATVVPTRAIPCAPDGARLAAHDTDPLVCWEAGCMKLAMLESTATLDKQKPVTPPRWLSPLGEIRVEAGKPSACLGAKCKPLGKKLVAAIEGARKDASPDQPLTLEATTDLKAVVVGYTAWSVAADKVLAPRPPATKDGGGPLGESGVQVAGDLLVFGWSNCAGPCTQATVNDSSGAAKSKLIAGGGVVTQLDAKRFAVVSEYGHVTVFTLAGTRTGEYDVDPRDPDASALRIGTNLYLMTHDMQGVTITEIALDDGALRRDGSMFLPACKP